MNEKSEKDAICGLKKLTMKVIVTPCDDGSYQTQINSSTRKFSIIVQFGSTCALIQL